MIRTYTPNALMRAAMDIARAHPLEGSAREVDDKELRALLEQIRKCPTDQLQLLAWSILPRQLHALCGDLHHNRCNKPIDKIVEVLAARMEPEYFAALFDQWQKYPDDRQILGLLARFDTEEYHPADLQIPVGMITRWSDAGDVFGEVNRYILESGDDQSIYRTRMKESGLRGSTVLYTCCLAQYLTGCSMAQFLREGDKTVCEAVKKASAELAEKILLNLLRCGAEDRGSLKRFPECFAQMNRLWRDPVKGRFPKDQEAARRLYRWLCNYSEMANGFMLDAEPRRRNFWEQYLDTCEVSRVRNHKMLIFSYKYDCVVEFEQVGQIYIFDKRYFRNTVLPTIINKPTQEAKSWLRKNSHPIYSRSHQGRWEPDVAEEMRKII